MSSVKETDSGLVALARGDTRGGLKKGVCSEDGRENSFESYLENS